MNKILENYRLNLEKETKLKVPKFDHLSTHTAKILTVLQDPGHSGAEISGVCSIDNDDPTANKLKEILENLNIDRTNVLFWNFYASYGLDIDKLNLDQKNFWAEKLNELVNLMPNLICIISLGNKSWDGFRYFKNEKLIRLIYGPHPSKRSMLQSGAEKKLISAWKKVKKLI